MSSFNFGHWIIFFFLAYLVYRIVAGVINTLALGPLTVCTTCGHHGQAKTRVRGSIWIELVLWVCFIVPGLIYSIWRLTTKQKICSSCGASNLVPPESPVGKEFLKKA